MLQSFGTSLAPIADRPTAADWLAYFQSNHANLYPINWQQPAQFTPLEKRHFSRSVAIFQLGESSEGHRLLKTARQWVAKGGDPVWVDVLKWFVREEQRHAADLGRLLDHEHVPRLKTHWADSAFRHLRGGLNLELSLSILLVAEVVGLLYARALQGATAHPIARTIAQQIEWDESQHLRMQSILLGLLRRDRSPRARRLTHALHRSVLWCTLRVVWPDHCAVFRAAGWTFREFAHAAMTELDQAIDPPTPTAMP